MRLEKKVDYGRPLRKYKNEENLQKALSSIQVPSNCGHDIDTDLIEETCDVADRFIKTVAENGKWYKTVEE